MKRPLYICFKRILTGLFTAVLFNAAHAGGGPGHALRFNNSANHVLVAHTNALNAYPLTVTAWFQVIPGAPLTMDLVKNRQEI